MVDCATVPLPDGATLVTFQDVTDTVNVERALRERNEALEAADKLKIDFVHHVSYELRSPLTNIIGFAHFLGDPLTGPLTEKQREYLGYITVSTNALLAIINNILDLATIDAGAMTLNLGSVDIRKTMEAAAEGVQDRLVKNGIRLEIRAAPDIGSFVADERRVRQSLFNLLANAVGFSPGGETVTFAAQRLQGCRGVLGDRSRTRHPARRAGQGVRLVRDPFARLAPPRHGPRPLPGALLRGAARRLGDARVGGRPRHHGHLRFRSITPPSERRRDSADPGVAPRRRGGPRTRVRERAAKRFANFGFKGALRTSASSEVRIRPAAVRDPLARDPEACPGLDPVGTGFGKDHAQNNR